MSEENATRLAIRMAKERDEWRAVAIGWRAIALLGLFVAVVELLILGQALS